MLLICRCAENSAGGAADIEAEPGHVIHDGGRRVHEGQHIVRWLLRRLLIHPPAIQLSDQAQAAGFNYVDLMKKKLAHVIANRQPC